MGLPNLTTAVESRFLFRVLFCFGFNLGLLKIKTFIRLCGSWFLHAGSLIFHRGVWTLSFVMWDTVTWPGVEPGPLRRECGFSAIGPPGKSVRHKILSLQSSRENLCWGAGRLTDTVPLSWWWFPQPEIVLNFGVAFLEPLEAAVSFLKPICPACPNHLFSEPGSLTSLASEGSLSVLWWRSKTRGF